MKNSEIKNKYVLLRKLVSFALVLVLGMSVLTPVFAEEKQPQYRKEHFSKQLEQEQEQKKTDYNTDYDDTLVEQLKKCKELIGAKDPGIDDYDPLMELFTLRNDVTASVTNLKTALELAGLVDAINVEKPSAILEEIGSQLLGKISDDSGLVNELETTADQFYILFKDQLTQLLDEIIANCEKEQTEKIRWNVEEVYSAKAQDICGRIQQITSIIDDYTGLKEKVDQLAVEQAAMEDQLAVEQAAMEDQLADEQAAMEAQLAVEQATMEELMKVQERLKELEPLLAQTFFSENSTVVAELAVAELQDRYNLLTLEREAQSKLEELTAQQEIEMSEITENVNANFAATNKKLLLGYIGLAVGAVSLIVGIIAMACGLRKQSDVTVDLSETASRDDVERLNAQNEKLREDNTLSEKRIDQLQEDIKRLQEEIERVRRTPAPVIDSQRETRDKPVVVAGPLPQKVGTYALQYQIINPSNSYLVPSAKGKYELYADNTLTLGENEKGKTNAMSSWCGSGQLYLFDAVIDKTEYTMEKANRLSGTYQIVGVDSPAVVKESSNPGQYVLVKKGKINMREV